MKIKNISGAVGFFTLAGRSRELAANEELVIPDTMENFNDAHNLQMQGLLTITESPARIGAVALAGRPTIGFFKITGAVANGDEVTIGDYTFLWAATAPDLAADEYYVAAGDTEATAATELAAAINASFAETGLRAVVATHDSNAYVYVTQESLTNPREPFSVTGADVTLTKSGDNIAVSAATSRNGEAGRSGRLAALVHDVLAADVTNTGLALATPFREGRLLSFMITRAGVPLYTWDGAVTVDDGFVVVQDSGEVALEAADVITALVQERFST